LNQANRTSTSQGKSTLSRINNQTTRNIQVRVKTWKAAPQKAYKTHQQLQKKRLLS